MRRDKTRGGDEQLVYTKKLMRLVQTIFMTSTTVPVFVNTFISTVAAPRVSFPLACELPLVFSALLVAVIYI